MRNKLTQDRLTLFIDQYANRYYATTRADLVKKVAQSAHVTKMYTDKQDGTTMWCGYVIGTYWLAAYRPLEVVPF